MLVRSPGSGGGELRLVPVENILRSLYVTLQQIDPKYTNPADKIFGTVTDKYKAAQ